MPVDQQPNKRVPELVRAIKLAYTMRSQSCFCAMRVGGGATWRIRWEPKGLYLEISSASVTGDNGKWAVVTITALQELRLLVDEGLGHPTRPAIQTNSSVGQV